MDQHSWQEQVVSRHTLIKKTEAKGHDLQPEWWQGFCFVRRSLLRPFVDGVEPPASHDSAAQLREATHGASVRLISSSLPLFYSLMASWSDSIRMSRAYRGHRMSRNGAGGGPGRGVGGAGWASVMSVWGWWRSVLGGSLRQQKEQSCFLFFCFWLGAAA